MHIKVLPKQYCLCPKRKFGSPRATKLYETNHFLSYDSNYIKVSNEKILLLLFDISFKTLKLILNFFAKRLDVL